MDQKTIERLSGNIEALSTVTSQLAAAAERLKSVAGEMASAHDKVLRKVEELAQRFVIPQEAIDELTGELRALRQLLDADGKYAFVDSVREKRKLDRARAGRKGRS